MAAPSDRPAATSPQTTAGPLIRPPQARTTAPGRRLPLAIAGLIAILLASAIGWRSFVGSGDADGGTSTAAPGAIELAAPIGGPERRDGPWARLRIAPARPGANTVDLRLTDAAGTPVAAAGAAPLRVAVASLDDPTAAQPVETEADAAGAVGGEAVLAGAGWYRADVAVGDPAAPETTLPFYLLLPDPNLHGADAVPVPEPDAAARAVHERGLAAMTGLHRVRYRQSMADGQGGIVYSEWAIDDGADGGTPAYAFRVAGGSESVVVGETRWLRRPGEGWETDAGAPTIPPAAWGDQYAGATGFRLGGEEAVDGEPSRIVTFVVPERTEPRRRAAAWYAWWVGVESGQVRREAMVSRNHYMVNQFADFDAPLGITPPPDIPAAATPTGPPSAADG